MSLETKRNRGGRRRLIRPADTVQSQGRAGKCLFPTPPACLPARGEARSSGAAAPGVGAVPQAAALGRHQRVWGELLNGEQGVRPRGRGKSHDILAPGQRLHRLGPGFWGSTSPISIFMMLVSQIFLAGAMCTNMLPVRLASATSYCVGQRIYTCSALTWLLG